MHAHSNDFIRLILKVFSMNSIKRHSRQKLKLGLNYTILELINVCMPTQNDFIRLRPFRTKYNRVRVDVV